eukprot:m.220966 g.220966  ORF g.220966 m.220966 type:complete len:84 (+) comp17243_c0_seq76:2300-2551(+)
MQPSRFLSHRVLATLQAGDLTTSDWAKHLGLLKERVDPGLCLTQAAKDAVNDAKEHYRPVCIHRMDCASIEPSCFASTIDTRL